MQEIQMCGNQNRFRKRWDVKKILININPTATNRPSQYWTADLAYGMWSQLQIDINSNGCIAWGNGL